MIKINKDLKEIPDSLKPSTSDFFVLPSQASNASRKTHRRRQELVSNGAYINENKYNSRYKREDVRIVLNLLYHRKCAFCEQRQEIPHVEHFRPKKIYYWLAYSWDNLIYSCSTCNVNKGSRFDIAGTRAQFVVDPVSPYRLIHSSCATLDILERPLLVNPEVEDLGHELVFNELGEVYSNNPRLQHTIDQCKISRDDLCYQRKKILDDFRRDLNATRLQNHNNFAQQLFEIEVFVKQFIRKSKSDEESFLAFRRFALKNKWISSDSYY